MKHQYYFALWALLLLLTGSIQEIHSRAVARRAPRINLCISGADLLCEGGPPVIYRIDSLPEQAKVLWRVRPGNVFLARGAALPNEFGPVVIAPDAQGAAVIEAIISWGDIPLKPLVLRKKIWIGRPSGLQVNAPVSIGKAHLNAGSRVLITAAVPDYPDSDPLLYNWEIRGAELISGQGTAQAEVRTPEPGRRLDVLLHVSNGCGSGFPSFTHWYTR